VGLQQINGYDKDRSHWTSTRRLKETGREKVTWQSSIKRALKSNGISLVTYVPDKVLIPLINELDDGVFNIFCATREEEAAGIATGAWLGGVPSAVLMQTSGFATLPNTLASLIVPYQIPLIMVVSERGTLGEFNIGQALVCRTVRPTLDSLGIETHTLADPDEVEFVTDLGIKQAIGTQQPVAFLLNPRLTKQ
jgi:sulfopyruvate decarboxylase TPP-binding subunit